jgi:hypothetical protein
MSDPETPDFHRRGDDLIARIDELAKVRGIDPMSEELRMDGNGWIFLLLACRRQLVHIQDWKDMNKNLVSTCRGLTEALKGHQLLQKNIETICGDGTSERRGFVGGNGNGLDGAAE